MELQALPISHREHRSQEQPDLSHLTHPQGSTRHGVGDQSTVLPVILAGPSASDFATAAAMLDLPPEFAGGTEWDESAVELDSKSVRRSMQE